MSAPPLSPKRWLLAADGSLLNVDFVMRLREDAAGKLFADTASGQIELQGDPNTFSDLRTMLPLNASNPVVP